MLLTALYLAQLAVTALPSTPKTRVSVAAAAMSFASSVLFTCVSDFEHRLSTRPSDFLAVFLFVTIVLDIIRLYSLYIIDGTVVVAIILTTVEAVKFMILILESWSKRAALRQPYSNYPSEALAGTISLSTFWWLNHLMWLGYKHSLTLNMLSELDSKMSAKNTSQRFSAGWKRGMNILT